MCTPLEAGYSVLGWNHPGFWGSTVRHSRWIIIALDAVLLKELLNTEICVVV